MTYLQVDYDWFNKYIEKEKKRDHNISKLGI